MTLAMVFQKGVRGKLIAPHQAGYWGPPSDIHSPILSPPAGAANRPCPEKAKDIVLIQVTLPDAE